MKIISWNVNGIRAAFRKDFFKWFKKTKADIYCLQELKAQEAQIPEQMLGLKNYHYCFNIAEKKGYSGVAVFSKQKPIKIEKKLGIKRFDKEGRILRLDFKDFILINFYIPHGGREKENLDYKLQVYKKIFLSLKKLKEKNIILVGDFNIAHKEIDLTRSKGNKNNIMFTEEERGQIDKLLDAGFIDTFRELNGDKIQYTWWSHFANARARNLGWRIDYVFCSKNFISKIKTAFILDKVHGSDHCPVGIDI